MPTYGGKGIHGKIIKVRPYESEGDDKLLWLTERQRGLMLAMTEYLDWRSRWETLPSPLDDDDERDAYVSGLKNRLMIVVEFCAEVIKCIDEDTDVQKSLSRVINNVIGRGDEVVPGERLPVERFEEDITGGSNTTCDPVILGRQCSYMVRFFNAGNIDFMEKIIVAANTIELAQQIAELPFVNLVTNQAGVTSALNFVVYMASAIKEQYDAGQSEAYMDELARKLFCICQDDCKITLDRFFQMTAENINEHIPKNITQALTKLVDILEIFTGLDTVGTDTVDLMYWLDGVLAKVVSFITFRLADRALDFGLASAAEDVTYNLDLTGLVCPPLCPIVPIANINPFTTNGQNTGKFVTAGQSYEVVVTGTWMNGSSVVDADGEVDHLVPSALVPTANIASLVYKIGALGEWREGGTEFEFTAEHEGDIYVAMNNTSDSYGGVSGALCMTVTNVVIP